MDNNKAKIYSWVFIDEGGYTNDPADNGGMTTWGITIAEVRTWRKDKSVGMREMKAFTQDEAQKIYDAWYWIPLACSKLPSGVDYMVFDCGLLHGIDRAGRWLQLAVGADVDGKIGPRTLALVKKTDSKAILAAMTDLRRRRAKSHPDYATFGRGWINRITRCNTRSLSLL